MGRHILRRFLAITILGLGTAQGPAAAPLPEAPGLPRPVPGQPPEVSGLVLPPAYPALLAPEQVFFAPLDQALIRQESTRMLARTSWFGQVLDRSRYFRQMIMSQIVAARIPRELFYLVLVESEFNPNAFSRSGAAGLWQFMPDSTPNHLLMDVWQDQRFDFVRAGKSAITKLVYNHSVLGSWSAALGAYNCGLNRLKAILGGTDGSQYWDAAVQAALPGETRTYVPRILASAWIANHAGRLGLAMAWEKPVYWDTITFASAIRLDELANLLGLPLSLVLLFNPEYRFEITARNRGGFHVRLPREYADVVLRELQ